MSNSTIPRADSNNYKATYESYEVACPICGKWNIFNRMSDIGSINVASGKTVKCLHCNKDFLIIGDKLNLKYEYFLEGCDDLIKQKNYMYCIIILCQSCEAFFMKCIDIKLLWKPYRSGVFGGYKGNKDFDDFAGKIHDRFDKFTYQKLLNVFFDLYLNNKNFKNEDDISNYLDNLSELSKSEPSKKEIETKSTGTQRNLFLELKELKINEIRNDVVHKDGFRPSLVDAQNYLNKVRRIIEEISKALDLEDMLSYCMYSEIMGQI